MNRPDQGHALMTDAEALTLAAEFDAAVANCPRTWGPTSHDLRLHPIDAARGASFGYSVEAELAQVGPEPSDVCETCLGSGWVDVDEWSIECDCQAVS